MCQKEQQTKVSHLQSYLPLPLLQESGESQEECAAWHRSLEAWLARGAIAKGVASLGEAKFGGLAAYMRVPERTLACPMEKMHLES